MTAEAYRSAKFAQVIAIGSVDVPLVLPESALVLLELAPVVLEPTPASPGIGEVTSV